jgi:hypothetical protein
MIYHAEFFKAPYARFYFRSRISAAKLLSYVFSASAEKKQAGNSPER